MVIVYEHRCTISYMYSYMQHLDKILIGDNNEQTMDCYYCFKEKILTGNSVFINMLFCISSDMIFFLIPQIINAYVYEYEYFHWDMQ